MPRNVVQRVHAGVKEALASAKVNDVLVSSGADAVGSVPEAFAGFLQNEIVKWGKVVRAAGIQPQ